MKTTELGTTILIASSVNKTDRRNKRNGFLVKNDAVWDQMYYFRWNGSSGHASCDSVVVTQYLYNMPELIILSIFIGGRVQMSEASQNIRLQLIRSRLSSKVR